MYYVTKGMSESVLMWKGAQDVEAIQEAPFQNNWSLLDLKILSVNDILLLYYLIYCLGRNHK